MLEGYPNYFRTTKLENHVIKAENVSDNAKCIYSLIEMNSVKK